MAMSANANALSLLPICAAQNRARQRPTEPCSPQLIDSFQLSSAKIALHLPE